MKVKVSYISEEKQEAAGVLAAIRSVLPAVRMRKSDRNPPYKHIYLTTKKAGKPCNSKEDVL